MRLVAIYILEHYLFNEPQTINISGKFIYTFNKTKKTINISRKKNGEYVTGLHSKSISELSAIVGANGSGKTTLFSIINKHNDDTKAIFVYEQLNDDIFIENRTGKKDENGNITIKGSCQILYDNQKYSNQGNPDIPVLYYSPIADEDLSSIYSPISKTKHFKSTLLEYHLDNVTRAIMLMTDDISKKIKEVYPQLPFYDFLHLQAKPLRKRDLRNLYGGFKEEGEIERSHKINLDKLWDQYEHKDKDKEHLIHENANFLKDLEVNIFSYLIIDFTSIKTAFNGYYHVSFDDYIKEKSFNEKLKHFFFNKLAHIDKYIFKRLYESFEDYDYYSLLFIFEGANFNEELLERQKKTVSFFESLATSINEQKRTVDLSEMKEGFESLFRKELDGEEFKGIRDNLIKFWDALSVQLVDEPDSFKQFIKDSIGKIQVGLEASFKSIHDSRYEIIDRLKDRAIRAVRLFDGIQKFYDELQKIKNKPGFQLNSGSITVNLKEADFKVFKNLISRYKTVIEEFNINSMINAQLIEFRPDKRLSFGEKSLIDLFSSIYEFTIKKYDYLRRKEHYILLLDEADLGYHPLWKKGYISAISKVLPILFQKLNEGVDNTGKEYLEERKIQIIISTHDCLTLSDIPNYNITYIDRDKENTNKSIVLSFEDKPKKSFGANVVDLLNHSFFIGDGLLGDFSKENINLVIDNLNFQILKNEIEELKGIKDKNQNQEELLESKMVELNKIEGKFELREKEFLRSLIDIIDEPILNFKLDEMYFKAFPKEIDKQEAIIRVKKILEDAGVNITDIN
ncbi:ATP-binding protein [Mangrovimonas xylaniphaga]|uniref:ATP-binding protein n=1 Tax=Mangrovimonas xylaniphaga TaxID=1645915 RepID=UPI0006B56790|nr:ATP-binding protein [Mangrovimonas xylaniphaga]